MTHGDHETPAATRRSTVTSRWRGIRSPASSAASGSTPRSTSSNSKVAECHSTSSIFRGYSIFMKGKDPRDAHFITSRICGICGDNHATCSCLQPEHGLRRQAAARSASGSSTSARPPSTCSTTTSSRRTWSAWTSASRWSRRPTRACSSKAENDRGAARRRSTATGRSPTSCGRSTRSRASSTARRCRSAATRARCSA